MEVSVVIPTYGREELLIETCTAVLQQTESSSELIVVDQTKEHETDTENALVAWERSGKIRWIRLVSPSIARAMNVGLRDSTKPIVLFLDDDIIPDSNLIAAHWTAHAETGASVVAGRVTQPWSHRGASSGKRLDDFDFNSTKRQYIDQFMGGNFSIRRDVAMQIGGVDENFVKVAYRFECDLADRLLGQGHRILYEPTAHINHLKAGSGGTRSYRERWINPAHGVGEYYYILRSSRLDRKLQRFFARPVRSVFTKYHTSRPWMVPVTFSTEVIAMFWALALAVKGPRLI